MERGVPLLRVMLVGTLWLGALFWLLPRLAMALNDQLDWPRWQHPALAIAGAALVATGVVVLVQASRLFRKLGEGTPVPTDPPKKLVRSGLYARSRNPIFAADVAILLGLFLLRGHLALLLYALLVFAGLHLWLRHHEEPALERRFGEAWRRYAREVPRWLT